MRDSLTEARRSEGGARVCRRGHLRPPGQQCHRLRSVQFLVPPGSSERCEARCPSRHCERSEAIHLASERKNGLLRRSAPKKKQTDKLLILFNVMDEPPPSVLFHPRGSAKGRCGTRNDGWLVPVPKNNLVHLSGRRPSL